MELSITMKDPDVVSQAVIDAATASTENTAGLSDDELESLAIDREEQINELISKWFKYGEYLTVDIDTDAGTCIVRPNL